MYVSHTSASGNADTSVPAFLQSCQWQQKNQIKSSSFAGITINEALDGVIGSRENKLKNEGSRGKG